MPIPSGSIVALITPMDTEHRVDTTALTRLINYHIQCETDAIVSIGTTGENATLNRAEKRAVVEHTIKIANAILPVFAGISVNGTADAIAAIQDLDDLNLAGYLVLTPAYIRPTQEGLYQHFKAIAQATNKPIILYNVPARTGCDLLPATIARLAEIKTICAIKEATGNLQRLQEIKNIVKRVDFKLFSGDDATALAFLLFGGSGIISVTANVAAADVAQLCRHALAGDVKAAQAINNRLGLLYERLFSETNPIPTKWACKHLGLISTDRIRLPLTPLTQNAQLPLIEALQQAKLI